jgi:hypothetical protein
MNSSFYALLSPSRACAWRRFFGGLCFALALSAQSAQSQTISFDPPVVREFEPFVVKVNFAREYCLNDSFPLLGESSLQVDVLSVVLTHVNTGPCSRNKQVSVPGLPAGSYRLRVSVSAHSAASSGLNGASVLAETVETALSVATLAPARELIAFSSTWIQSGDDVASHSPPAPDPNAVLLLWPFRDVLRGGRWLEVGANLDAAYTFKAIYSPDSQRVPQALLPLYFIPYPLPLHGWYYSTDKALIDRLARQWQGATSVTSEWLGALGLRTDGVALVGRVVGGACGLGMSPVYQLFNPAAIKHRWTQSRATYALLQSAGYVAEGPAWCAPALRGE